MTTDEFWQIIETARTRDTDPEAVADEVRRMFATMSLESILEFDHQRILRMGESYRWDLWGVAYIINGGCSDDGFDYFRGWLIAKGRTYFEAALADPVRAADEAEQDNIECEDMLGAALSAYKARTGEYPPRSSAPIPHPREPAGDSWEEEDLETLYPSLYKRFT
jgi:hypothetical protein